MCKAPTQSTLLSLARPTVTIIFPGLWRKSVSILPVSPNPQALALGAGDADTDQFREELDGARSTPEQLFADSQLVLRHEHTGIALSFTAGAALHAWKVAKVAPVKVLSAQTWMSTQEKGITAHQAVSFDYGW